MKSGITHLIVNSPYEEPEHHWHYHRETPTFSLQDGRRAAGSVIASESSMAFADPGRFIPIELVNQIRPRAKAWRAGRTGRSGGGHGPPLYRGWDWRRLSSGLDAFCGLVAKQGEYLPKGVEFAVRFNAKLAIQKNRFRTPAPAGATAPDFVPGPCL
jgi:hypothetical protein